jgi:hypothetical protein
VLEKQRINAEEYQGEDRENLGSQEEVEVDVGPVLKVLERRNYEQKRYLFPYKNWTTFELSGYRN